MSSLSAECGIIRGPSPKSFLSLIKLVCFLMSTTIIRRGFSNLLLNKLWIKSLYFMHILSFTRYWPLIFHTLIHTCGKLFSTFLSRLKLFPTADFALYCTNCGYDYCAVWYSVSAFTDISFTPHGSFPGYAQYFHTGCPCVCGKVEKAVQNILLMQKLILTYGGKNNE